MNVTSANLTTVTRGQADLYNIAPERPRGSRSVCHVNLRGKTKVTLTLVSVDCAAPPESRLLTSAERTNIMDSIATKNDGLTGIGSAVTDVITPERHAELSLP
jgi:hypothetical protein